MLQAHVIATAKDAFSISSSTSTTAFAPSFPRAGGSNRLLRLAMPGGGPGDIRSASHTNACLTFTWHECPFLPNLRAPSRRRDYGVTGRRRRLRQRRILLPPPGLGRFNGLQDTFPCALLSRTRRLDARSPAPSMSGILRLNHRDPARRCPVSCASIIGARRLKARNHALYCLNAGVVLPKKVPCLAVPQPTHSGLRCACLTHDRAE
ncbi:hypothetical protein SODG_006639 [Sodalis praecaptivus]|nr:hypothetical protein NVIRENTERO_03184 [Sodalis praecaptivus]